MSGVTLDVRVEKLRLAAPFRISGFVFEEQDVVVVELRDGGHRGRGEASGVYYLDDKVEKIVDTIESRRTAIETGLGPRIAATTAATWWRTQRSRLRNVGARSLAQRAPCG